jgi:hypothetical protein
MMGHTFEDGRQVIQTQRETPSFLPKVITNRTKTTRINVTQCTLRNKQKTDGNRDAVALFNGREALMGNTVNYEQ